jgi:serine phosphatase RsbU (regulator of sigma subunit)
MNLITTRISAFVVGAFMVMWIPLAMAAADDTAPDSTSVLALVAEMRALPRNDTVRSATAQERLLTTLGPLPDDRFKLRMFHALATSGSRVNGTKVRAARLGLILARTLKADDWEARFHHILASYAADRGQRTIMVAHLDSGLNALGGPSPAISGLLKRDRGRAVYEQGDYKAAMDWYLGAQKDFDGAGIRNADYAHLLHYIGSVFKRTNNDSRALGYYEEMLALGRSLNDTVVMCEAYDLASDVYEHLGQPLKAQEYLEQAVALAETNGSSDLQIQVICNAAHHWKNRKDYTKAIALAYRAQSIMLRTGDRSSEIFLTRLLGNLHSKKGEHDKAFELLNEALRLSEQSNYKRTLFLSEAYNSLAFAAERKGDYRAAFDYLLYYLDYRDSLINEQNVNAIAEMEQRYEAEKKTSEIKLLSLDKELNEKELGRQKIIKNVFVGGFILALALVGGIYYSLDRNRKKNALITRQKELVEKKNHEVMESIIYARRLQEAVLPPPKLVREFFTDSFLFYLPRDIVSGDFYWMESRNGKSYFAVGDCTGHGVPGAMLSVIGLNGLNRGLNDLNIAQPRDLLMHLTIEFQSAFERSDATVRDGMDIALCTLDLNTRELVYAGANSPLWVARGKEMLLLKADRKAVGHNDGALVAFTQQRMTLEPGDVVYLFSDGYADQMGGPEGKKLMRRKFRELLLEIAHLPMPEQRNRLLAIHNAWKGEGQQTDDMCVMAVRVS